MPKFDPKKVWSFHEIKSAATNGRFLLNPYGMGGPGGIGYLRDVDGFGTRAIVSEPPDETLWASFIFNTGEIWGVDAYLLAAANGHIVIDRAGMTDALTRYRELLRALGISGPYRWIAGFEGVKGRSLVPSSANSTFAPRGMSLVDEIVVDGELSDEQYSESAVKAFVSKVYDVCGLPPPA